MKRSGTLVVLAMGLVCACASPPSGDDEGGVDLPRRSGGSRGDGGASGSSGDPSDPSAPGDPGGTTPVTPPDGQTDDPNALCNPNDPAAGVRIFDGALGTDTQKLAVAAGFPPASWAYQASAYQQLRLVDAGDASFFVGTETVDAVDVEVRAASTAISDAITPRLRQLFVLVGARTTNGSLDAYGCGAEVVQGLSPEQRSSVVKLSGPPSAVTTTALARTARLVLKAGEDFTIHARLRDGKIACTVTQGTADTITTAEAPVTGVVGSVGLFTRQTKAAFKTARVCRLRLT